MLICDGPYNNHVLVYYESQRLRKLKYENEAGKAEGEWVQLYLFLKAA